MIFTYLILSIIINYDESQKTYCQPFVNAEMLYEKQFSLRKTAKNIN